MHDCLGRVKNIQVLVLYNWESPFDWQCFVPLCEFLGYIPKLIVKGGKMVAPLESSTENLLIGKFVLEPHDGYQTTNMAPMFSSIPTSVTELVVTMDPTDAAHFTKQVHMMTHLSSLDIEVMGYILPPLFHTTLLNCTFLQHIHFHNAQELCEDKHVDLLQNSGLTSLSVTYYNTDVSDLIEHLPTTLQSLHFETKLANTSRSTPQNRHPQEAALLALPELKSLSLWNRSRNKDWIDFSGFTQLESLTVTKIEMTNLDILLKNNYVIKHLDLQPYKDFEYDDVKLMNAITTCTNLVTLRLSGMTHALFQELSMDLPRLVLLEEFSFEAMSNPMTLVMWEELWHALVKCRNLVKVSLGADSLHYRKMLDIVVENLALCGFWNLKLWRRDIVSSKFFQVTIMRQFKRLLTLQAICNGV